MVVTGRHIPDTLQASFSGTIPPDPAVNGYVSEEALTVSVHPSTKVTHMSCTVSTFSKIGDFFIFSTETGSSIALKHAQKHRP